MKVPPLPMAMPSSTLLSLLWSRHLLLCRWRFITIVSSALSPFNSVIIEVHHPCGVLSLSASSPLCNRDHCCFLDCLLFARGSIGTPHSNVVFIALSLSSCIGDCCLMPSYPSHHLVALVVHWLLFQVVDAIIAAAVLPVCGNGSISIVIVVCHRRHVGAITTLCHWCLPFLPGGGSEGRDMQQMILIVFFVVVVADSDDGLPRCWVGC